MSEAIFPLSGALFVILGVLPMSAAAAKVVLLWMERDNGALHGLNVRYAAIITASILPLAWFFSAGIHQAEAGSTVVACLLAHESSKFCLEPGVFAGVLGALVGVATWDTLRRTGRVQSASSNAGNELAQRVTRLLQCEEDLGFLLGRLVPTEAHDFAVATRGLIRPRVYVGVTYAARLTDEMLLAALAHEAEHVRSRDPLRYLVLELSLRINPIGRWLLGEHAARWRVAREAHCDREAVLAGAAPLSLADAIICAARPVPREIAALGAEDVQVLKFRVGMLVAFSERFPRRCCHESNLPLACAFVLVSTALLLPHQAGTEALDLLHTGVELALTSLWR